MRDLNACHLWSIIFLTNIDFLLPLYHGIGLAI